MADRTYKGVVSEVSEREWYDRKADENIMLYSFRIESENRYFRTGTTNPNLKQGEAISFVASTPKNDVDINSIKRVDADEIAPPRPSGKRGGGYAKGGGSGGGSARDTYWDDKAKRDQEITEPRISYSAAQRNATALVVAALQADILAFGQTSKGAKLDMLVDFVEQTTLRLAQLQMDAPAIMKGVTDAGE